MAEQRKTSEAAAESELADNSRNKPEKRKKHTRDPLPLVLKLLLVPFLLFVSLLIGMLVGYSLLGKGAAIDVFDLHTWTHMYDLVFK
ncbi:DNA-directed RNA polymerase subunit beta [Aneurinibacillus sp. Ricciae_BoGa-3]|uniref:DNA-directed RNA polymerase subunit beta n=1 Tax=Aneurinibacillus sp. Ricciae_BoGa-3 TaxID=3022697 RepID=UPI00233F97AE|nr:DNA-directed RNA polymerase subunit beta [Aneurinibacillus sp. Ricciae_BoGa-3]WCK54313.1 DNA-directed RNA polymerase subunit beta [Aneurinibacillus sp. Ricciae_BoGa-3]